MPTQQTQDSLPAGEQGPLTDRMEGYGQITPWIRHSQLTRQRFANCPGMAGPVPDFACIVSCLGHGQNCLGIRVGHGSLFQNPTQPNPKFLDPTQHNPQKSSPDPTQPSSTLDNWYGILGYTENFIQVIIQLQYSLTDSRVFHDVKNITQSSLHPTQPNPTHG